MGGISLFGAIGGLCTDCKDCAGPGLAYASYRGLTYTEWVSLPFAPPKPKSSLPGAAGPVLAAPLHQVLMQVADAVQAVRGGRSLTELLSKCPAELRPATQSLSFHVLRPPG